MNNINLQSSPAALSAISAPRPAPPPAAAADNPALHKAFNEFVGQTFYGQMLQAMRKSQGKPAYMYGGQAEEIFTQQLDQMLTKKLSDTSAGKLSEPMYKLFTQSRK